MARRQVLAGTHKPIAANKLRTATVEAAAAAASEDEPGPNPAVFAWLSVNCCKPEATVQSIESTSVIRPRLKRHPRPRLASSSASDLPSSKREEKHTAASDPDGDNTDGNQTCPAVLRAVDDGILLRRRHSPNITVGAKKILAFAREINIDPGHFITIP